MEGVPIDRLPYTLRRHSEESGKRAKVLAEKAAEKAGMGAA